MEINIYGTIRHEVSINPIDVIDRLLVKQIGYGNYVKLIEGDAYIAYEDHRMEVVASTPLPKESYEYIKALELVKKTLSEKK